MSFFCKLCGKTVSEIGSAYHPTRRGKLFSAVRRHYWKYHPEVFGKVYKGGNPNPDSEVEKGLSPDPARRRRRRASPRTRTVYRYIRAPARRIRRGLRIGKGLSLKSILAGSLGYLVMRRYQPFGGVWKDTIDKVALGVILPAAKLDNHDFLSVGIKEAIAKAVDMYLLGGAVTSSVGGGYQIG
jgi:hypothetical protein